eukprot:XP_022278178.1 uncharacterized protein LOC111097191 [Canis lupus familiaris]
MPPLAASAKTDGPDSKRQQEKELAKVTIKKEDLELTVTETFPSRPAPPFPPRSEAPNSPGRPRPPARRPRGGRPRGRGGLVYGRTAQARSPGAPGAAGRPQAPPPGAASGRPPGGAGEAVGRRLRRLRRLRPRRGCLRRRRLPATRPAGEQTPRRGCGRERRRDLERPAQPGGAEGEGRAPVRGGHVGSPGVLPRGTAGAPRSWGPLPRATRTTLGDPSAPPRATFREDESPSGGAHLSHQPPRIVHNCLCQCCSKCLSARKRVCVARKPSASQRTLLRALPP